MSDELYSDVPPTEPGWYFLQAKSPKKQERVQFFDGRWWYFSGIAYDTETVANGRPLVPGNKFGPRVPSPTEFAELKRELEIVAAYRDDYAALVEKLTASINNKHEGMQRDAERFRTCEQNAMKTGSLGVWWWKVTIAVCSDTFTAAVDAAKETP